MGKEGRKKKGGGEGGRTVGKRLWCSGQVCVLATSLEQIKPVIVLCLLSSWLLCHRPPHGTEGPTSRTVTGVGGGVPTRRGLARGRP